MLGAGPTLLPRSGGVGLSRGLARDPLLSSGTGSGRAAPALTLVEPGFRID